MWITSKADKRSFILAALVALLALPACLPGSGAQAQTPTPPVSSQPAGRLYPQTGKTLAPEFVSFYDANGGVPIFGYPLTNAEAEGDIKVQYLERARIEYHPENHGTQYEVQLGLLGSILNRGRYFATASAPRTTVAGLAYFPETQHTLSGAFLQYWQGHGGLALFGYPISEPVQEGGYTVQYFQRNRFEYHPENHGTQYEVLLGLLGRDLLAQRVQVSETTVMLPTYAYEQGYTSPTNSTIGPYPGLDMTRVGPPAMRPHKLVVLENRYLRLTVMPELGGRLYEVIYKPTGHDELYRNPVIKPSTFGARGWWLAAGGMEWAAPTDEHGLMEYLPWTYTTERNTEGGAIVTVSATDRLTGLQVVGSIALNPEQDAYTVSARMENHTGAQQRGQLWTNAMVAPGGTNHVSPRTRFIVPSNEMVVHSTSDTGLPAAHGVVGWPQQEGRNLADTSTWRGWLGGFFLPVATRGSFAAVYNPDVDEGMVKTFDDGKMPGLKIFGFGPRFDASVYTDGDSSYSELWGGITPTFWDYAVFPPNSSLGWTEQWQPVASVAGVSLANSWGTVSVDGAGTARVLPVSRIEGATLMVRNSRGQTATQGFNAYPDRPATVAVPIPGPITEIEVISPDGKSLLKGAPAQ